MPELKLNELGDVGLFRRKYFVVQESIQPQTFRCKALIETVCFVWRTSLLAAE